MSKQQPRRKARRRASRVTFRRQDVAVLFDTIDLVAAIVGLFTSSQVKPAENVTEDIDHEIVEFKELPAPDK